MHYMPIGFGTFFQWLIVEYIGLVVLGIIVPFGWILWRQRGKEYDGSYGESDQKNDDLRK